GGGRSQLAGERHRSRVGRASGGSVRGRARSDRQDQGGGADLEARGPRGRNRSPGGGVAIPRPAVLAMADRAAEGSPSTHLDAQGRARMVDVGGKEPTERIARARALLRMTPGTARAVEIGNTPKGEVLGAARIAGIQAAKRTAELIPLAHPLALTFVDVTA